MRAIACCLCCLACVAAAGMLSPPAAMAADVIQVDLQTQLEKGLKARRPQEFQFIERVVAEVQAGRLPQSLVDSTFLWARKKPEHPFQYFEAAMKIRAKRVGVNL